MITYVHEGVEVKLTGRLAEKKIGPERKQRTISLAEITPADAYNGEWKKWVDKSVLFTVLESNEEIA